MWIHICVAVCLALHLAGAAPMTSLLPKEFKICKRGDDVCLKAAVIQAIPYLATGLQKLGTISFDPLKVTDITSDQGKGPINFKVSFKNQDFVGVRQVKIVNVRSNLTDKNYMVTVEGIIPTVTGIGSYTIGGKILLLPIQGEGRDNVTVYNTSVKVNLIGHVTKRDGEDFVQVDTVTVKVNCELMRIRLENLFGGDRVLGETMNQVLNENWTAMLEIVQPAVEVAYALAYKQVANRIYSAVPYIVIHPKIL